MPYIFIRSANGEQRECEEGSRWGQPGDLPTKNENIVPTSPSINRSRHDTINQSNMNEGTLNLRQLHFIQYVLIINNTLFLQSKKHEDPCHVRIKSRRVRTTLYVRDLRQARKSSRSSSSSLQKIRKPTANNQEVHYYGQCDVQRSALTLHGTASTTMPSPWRLSWPVQLFPFSFFLPAIRSRSKPFVPKRRK